LKFPYFPPERKKREPPYAAGKIGRESGSKVPFDEQWKKGVQQQWVTQHGGGDEHISEWGKECMRLLAIGEKGEGFSMPI